MELIVTIQQLEWQFHTCSRRRGARGLGEMTRFSCRSVARRNYGGRTRGGRRDYEPQGERRAGAVCVTSALLVRTGLGRVPLSL